MMVAKYRMDGPLLKLDLILLQNFLKLIKNGLAHSRSCFNGLSKYFSQFVWSHDVTDILFEVFLSIPSRYLTFESRKTTT